MGGASGEPGDLAGLTYRTDRMGGRLNRQRVLDWFPVVATAEYDYWYDIPRVEDVDVPSPDSVTPCPPEGFLSPTQSVITRIGAKAELATKLVSWFPRSYCYVEPFAATLKVLFTKPWRDRVEIVNDFDTDLVEFWRWARHAPDRLIEAINETPIHEGIIYGVRDQLGRRKYQGLHRAAAWFIASQSSFNGKVDQSSLGLTSVKGIHYKLDPALVQGVVKRLRGVTILSRDFERVITILNKSMPAKNFPPGGVFFYLDPPYWMTAGYKMMDGSGSFPWEKQVRLSQLCVEIDQMGNKFLQTNSYHPDLLRLYGGYKREDGSPRFHLREEKVRYTIGGKEADVFSELIVSNYPLADRPQGQTKLFGG